MKKSVKIPVLHYTTGTVVDVKVKFNPKGGPTVGKLKVTLDTSEPNRFEYAGNDSYGLFASLCLGSILSQQGVTVYYTGFTTPYLIHHIVVPGTPLVPKKTKGAPSPPQLFRR